MSKNCYVRVTNSINQEVYDVGPFSYSGNEPFTESESAITWIYKQIGLIKIQAPEATLIKHRWNYTNEPFDGAKADILVEIGGFNFEIINLVDYKYHNVLSELVTKADSSADFDTNIDTLI